jgi:ribulose-phosphate 3-epimerase
MNQKLVAPSILSADFAHLDREIQAVTKAGADWIHVDVMDGHFVDNITLGPAVVSSLKKICQIPLDVHLMIENPEKYIEAFAKAGSDYLTIHIETTKQPLVLLNKIKSLGVKAGITLRPRTALSEIVPWLENVDLVLVMTVEPGFGGQSFMQEQVSKISELVKLRAQKKLNFLIEVDGGINAQTVAQAHEADVFVAGNFVFKNDYAQAIRTLKGIS